ncbi:GNAT family N-acetyltransferase [Alkalicoccus urumqiensis]|uniref:GNAT family N-acetyltransferase n=1 Tax=Alkalicoccus urumqiensis TaxID=1548213 RepID=A0A2P6MJP7_ALKUR|nr:GNAT family N-acetyltransferase [Alkalicoccus urumqiensis]PRO66499.1 GNAT family N-acetyltransferase [Alkalicoccus urumqiensis]
MTVELKPCSKQDIETLAAISQKTFQETFQEQNTPEDLDAYLRRAFSTEQLRRELETDGTSFYLLYENSAPAGYLKLNTGGAQSEPMGADALEVERIYVLQAFQGRGFGRLLLDEAFQKARDAGMKRIWLGVWEKNEHAIAFYERRGFVKTGSHSFFLGTDEQTDYLYAVDL